MHRITNSRMTQIWVAVLFVLTFAMGGCAFGDRRVTLSYSRMDDVPIAKTEGQAVTVVAFMDERNDVEDKRIVGRVRNGYGIPTANVVTEDQDVGQWVADSLARELEHAGYDVNRVSTVAEAPPGQPAVTGAITTLYTDLYMNYNTDLILNIRVMSGSTVLLEKTYEGDGGGVAWLVTSGEYAKSMNEGLHDAFYQLLPELTAAIEQ